LGLRRNDFRVDVFELGVSVGIRLAVSERPVVPTGPDEAEEDILPPDSETLVESTTRL
jgi:hypothetical protein